MHMASLHVRAERIGMERPSGYRGERPVDEETLETCQARAYFEGARQAERRAME